MRAARGCRLAGTSLALAAAVVLTVAPLDAQTRTDRAPAAPSGSPTSPADTQKPADMQQKPADMQKAPADMQKAPAPGARDDKSSLSRSITGTVKKAGADALVIEETKRDGSGGKEWAFTVEGSTRTRAAKGGQTLKAGELKEGDRVAVTYTERGGKIIADSVTVLEGGSPR